MSNTNDRFYLDFISGTNMQKSFFFIISLFIDTEDVTNMDLSNLQGPSLGKYN